MRSLYRPVGSQSPFLSMIHEEKQTVLSRTSPLFGDAVIYFKFSNFSKFSRNRTIRTQYHSRTHRRKPSARPSLQASASWWRLLAGAAEWAAGAMACSGVFRHVSGLKDGNQDEIFRVTGDGLGAAHYLIHLSDIVWNPFKGGIGLVNFGFLNFKQTEQSPTATWSLQCWLLIDQWPTLLCRDRRSIPEPACPCGQTWWRHWQNPAVEELLCLHQEILAATCSNNESWAPGIEHHRSFHLRKSWQCNSWKELQVVLLRHDSWSSCVKSESILSTTSTVCREVQRQEHIEWRQCDCVAGAADTFSSLRLPRRLCWTTFEHQSYSSCFFCSCAKIPTVYASFVFFVVDHDSSIQRRPFFTKKKSVFTFFQERQNPLMERWLPGSSNTAPASEAPIEGHLVHLSR